MQHQRVLIDVAGKRPEAPRTRRWRGRLVRWLKTPIATVVWGVMLWWCVASIPTGNSAEPPGAPRVVNSSGQKYAPMPWAFLARANDGTIVAIEPGKEKPSDRIIGNAQFDYRLRPEFEGRYIGVWADLKKGEEGAARQAFLDWLGTSKEKYWRDMAARLKGKDDVDVMSYQGRRVVQSLASLVLVGLIVWSLAWTAPYVKMITAPLQNMTLDPDEREKRRRTKALRAGRCPGCGYEIRGLPKRKCPECGEVWGLAEMKG